MSFIFCAQTVLGNLFVIRTLQFFYGRALIPTKTLKRTGIVVIGTVSCSVFFCANAGISAGFLIFIEHLSCIPFLMLMERRKIQQLRFEFNIFLQRWIMNLKLGAAATAAREKSLQTQSEAFQALIRPIFASTNASLLIRNHPLMSTSVLRELLRATNEPHCTLARLENLREMLRKADEFRRKSGQATRQTTIQSVVMLVLLFALMIFTLHRYGWRRCSDLVLWSVLFSTLGVVSMTFLARKTRWKV